MGSSLSDFAFKILWQNLLWKCLRIFLMFVNNVQQHCSMYFMCRSMCDRYD